MCFFLTVALFLWIQRIKRTTTMFGCPPKKISRQETPNSSAMQQETNIKQNILGRHFSLNRSQVAILQPELWECSSRTTFVLKASDFWAGAAGARFAYYFLYFKLANFVPKLWMRTSRTTFALRSCDIAAGALGMLFAYYFRN